MLSALAIAVCSRKGRTKNVQFWFGLLNEPGGRVPFTSWKLFMAMPYCFRLLTHWIRLAAARADCTAGSNKAMRTAMIAMTTSSSIRVKPLERRDIRDSPGSCVKGTLGERGTSASHGSRIDLKLMDASAPDSAGL